ncbi:hypothetical protein H632_c1229p0, partial [Helicosporidium sp. ATCC 50920]
MTGEEAPGDPYILTNATIPTILRRVATAKNEVVFTTLVLKKGEGVSGSNMQMLSNFCYWLDRVNALEHTLIITTDAYTHRSIRDAGFPSYLDRAFPLPSIFPNYAVKHPSTSNSIYYHTKWWWGWAIANAGFRQVFMDSDAIPLKSPWTLFQPDKYDLQGLSDWRTAELPEPGASLRDFCDMYWMVPWESAPAKHMVRQRWAIPGDFKKGARAPFYGPCQSAGVWVMEPRPSTLRPMAQMVRRLRTPETVSQWDQALWNEVVVTHLWGMGREQPLRYRLFPHSVAANVGPYDERRRRGLPTNLAVVHLGYVNGEDNKVAAYTRLGLWRGDYSRKDNPVAFPNPVEESDAAGAAARAASAASAQFGAWQDVATHAGPAVR